MNNSDREIVIQKMMEERELELWNELQSLNSEVCWWKPRTWRLSDRAILRLEWRQIAWVLIEETYDARSWEARADVRSRLFRKES